MSQRPGNQRDRVVEFPAEPEHDGSELPEGGMMATVVNVKRSQGCAISSRQGRSTIAHRFNGGTRTTTKQRVP